MVKAQIRYINFPAMKSVEVIHLYKDGGEKWSRMYSSPSSSSIRRLERLSEVDYAEILPITADEISSAADARAAERAVQDKWVEDMKKVGTYPGRGW